MHDAPAVGGVEGGGDLDAVLDHLRHRDRTLRDAIGKRLSLDELEDEEVDVGTVHLLAAHVMDRADVRMVERGDRFRLAFEARAERFVVREAGRENLDRDLALQARVPGPVDLAHAAGAERGDDLVGPEPGCGGQAR